MNLEYAALSWLRYQKKCPLVLFERSPLYNGGVPDVLGVTQSRWAIEIEIKRSVSDFKANADKDCIRNREKYLDHWPYIYYFMVSKTLVEKVMPLVPEWAGLMQCDYLQAFVVKQAPSNKAAKKLTPKQMIRLVQLQSNQITAQCRHINSMIERSDKFEWHDVHSYSI